ncbi:outer membrane beta-barrel family protein [Chitinophaga sp. CF418]|uniref:outer membrane beta-barrel family protein n=1 Tax=Chitinophaga sp. CF418 TaxID=1855287 RepID=UPI000913676A|nr:outer membrane beta-barrel family protein [Chitinophaga sp. CF418]SHL97661.1 Outer membrane protein beta-barrel family protein [Chitinophaga sp. CF418]
MAKVFSFFCFLVMINLYARAQDSTIGTRQLQAVEVNAAPPSVRQQADKLVMTVAGNRLFRTAANGFDVLKKVPGLEVGGDGALLLYGRITPAVFIDGKPVLMSPEALQNYLAGLSSDMIASIALINNPSSQYDAEYKAIIDIRLKQDMTMGWKGNINTSLQRNAYTYSDNQLQLSYKTPKLTYTTRLGYTRGTTIYRYQALQHLANTDIMATNNNVPTSNNNFSYQLGADYNFKKNQHIELQLRGFLINRNAHAYNTLYTTDATAQHLVFNTKSENHYDPTQRNYLVNLNYSGQWGKTQLQLLGSFVQANTRQQEDIQTSDVISKALLDYWKTALQQDIRIRTMQADLSRETGIGTFRMGGKFVYTSTRNNIHYDTLTTEHVFAPDSGRSNNFSYDEYISAGYLSYERKQGKFDLAAGLRAEHTRSIANSITQNEVTKRNYLTWLPSISATYTINQDQQIGISFARRITRPTFSQLNPFRFYNSPLNYVVGNPYLLPSKSNTLALTYTIRSFTFALNAGRETDAMLRYPEYDTVTNVLEYLGKNMPHKDFANITVSVPFTVTKWWRMQHNISSDYRKEQIPYHGVTYAVGVTDFTIRGSQVFTLPKSFTFDVSYSYRSRSGISLYIAKPLWNVDIGLQRTWLKGKLNTRINYYDMFNSTAFAIVFREKQIINNQLSHWYGQQRVVLTLNYSFGKSTYRAKQVNKNEEENRAGL